MVTMTRSSSSNGVVPLSITLLFITTASLLTIGVKAFSSSSFQKAQTAQKMEDVVRRYFDGVNKKDPVQIRSCFGETATIRDVGFSHTARTVQASTLVETTMEFVTAHPDAKVDFYYGPEKGRTSAWVVVHWFETGTWSGDSYGIPAPVGTAVEGQTRFLVDREALKITDIVVTRTFTESDERMLEKRQARAQAYAKQQ